MGSRSAEKLKISTPSNRNKIVAFLLTLALTAIAYWPSLSNGFTNWDDVDYVVKNGTLRELSQQNIKIYFTRVFQGNYHPLTLLSLSIDYFFGELRPGVYHFTNFLLHIFNTALVFWLVFLLVDQLEMAFICAALFGLHTLHVESVAWISERKDVLYAFFFLSSLLMYVKYIKEHKNKFYWLALLLFMLSLLSKGMAVSLSITLIAIDYLLQRKFNKQVFLEKIPFLLLSLLFGIIAIMAQKQTGAIGHNINYPIIDRIIYSSYGFIQYILKLILPIHLSAFYPYPYKIPLPFYFWIYPLTILLLTVLVFLLRKRSRKFVFGFAFFVINIILVLQFLPVGSAVMADRYSYIASIGFFFLIASGYEYLQNNNKKIIFLVNILLAGYLILLSAFTYSRCKIWKDSMTLWNDVIYKYPQQVDVAYHNRGAARETVDTAGAMSDYTMAISLNSDYADPLNNRGGLKFLQGDYAGAVADYSKFLSIKGDWPEVYMNRASANYLLKNYKAALADLTKTIELDTSRAAEAYYKRGNIYFEFKNYPEAILNYSKAVELNPAAKPAFYSLGNSKYYVKDLKGAINAFSRAIELNPQFAEAYNNRGFARLDSGDKAGACADWSFALKYGYVSARGFLDQYCK